MAGRPERAVTAYIALGANLGDRLASLRSAARRLADHPRVQLDRAGGVAPLFETSPHRTTEPQPAYCNSAVRITTSLTPEQLLEFLHQIEHSLGRRRSQPNAAREIDLDLLLFDQLTVDSPRLTVPHPRLHERLFVLEPLACIAPDVIHPRLQQPVSKLLEQCRSTTSESIRRMAGPEWLDG